MLSHGHASSLLRELALLDLRLQRQVLRLRARHQWVESDFRGTFISDAQVDALLQARIDLSSEAQVQAFARRIADLVDETGRAEPVSQPAGAPPLARLSALFDLNEVERHLLIVALAPALDLRYETIYAYAQNDVNRKLPTLDLALKLLFDDLPTRMDALGCVDDQAPLILWDMLRLIPDPQDAAPTRLAHYLRIDERLASFLVGSQEIDQRLRGFTRFAAPAVPIDELPVPEDTRLAMKYVLRMLTQGPAIVFLQGAPGVGKRSAAAAMSAALGRRLLLVDVSAVADSNPAGLTPDQFLRLLERETRLQDAALYFHGWEFLPREETQPAWLRGLSSLQAPLFVGSAKPGLNDRTWPELPFIELDLPLPPYHQRLQLWKEALDGKPLHPQANLAAVAGKFALGPLQIRDAARYAAALTATRPPAESAITTNDLHSAARARSNQSLRELGQKLEARYGWDDLVLPRRSQEALREVFLSVKHKHTVYEIWGFEQKLAMNKGVNALFYGPSGTGKTLAAQVLANELKLDLYRIDLATVVSKYIGETEKNLNRVFAAAEASNAILFFDEADALFGKRSEVKDAHDRYANIEVAYLLQKMEAYDGIAILATNLRGNIDEAFARRLHHTVEFPFPDAALRERIWRGVFPGQTPLSEAIDIPFLARQFELSGGNIRNVALAAAFLAAEADRPVDMPMLVTGVARELQKIDRMPTRSAFREYYTFVQEGAAPL